ncbi:hypothetical protein [Cellulomonas aerilata]|uniref:Serine protease n=1 Tax=Cellulomonas aerilata TaxID=515326 RepID=A0A512D7V4_9CELL|nr:hypothetical protein [Cellulomonas aerilata]GEO32549.1 hypothetical protein CAE01nite_02740 [Cellulomonas aerilata]
MDRNEARETKRQIAGYVEELLAERIDARSVGPQVPAVGLGLRPLPDGGYGLAVRYRLGVPTARMVARKVAEQVGPVADVRRTGRISVVPRQGTGPRPPVVTAQALGETDRVRPLRPGVSIAHVDVSAGTLGAFVRVDGVLHALSNFHVLVGSPSAKAGDPVLQPGPADGGQDPQDRVGTLAGFVPLQAGEDHLVDAAIARLDDTDVDLAYPVGLVTETAEVDGTEQVAKIGRTTGLTQGHVTAIELDDVVVGYGDEMGELRFDNQVEVQSNGPRPFSRGGDSGSLVYRTDGVAIGLLFAGSEAGGDNGNGLTYLNPIGAVLDALGAELAG